VDAAPNTNVQQGVREDLRGGRDLELPAMEGEGDEERLPSGNHRDVREELPRRLGGVRRVLIQQCGQEHSLEVTLPDGSVLVGSHDDVVAAIRLNGYSNSGIEQGRYLFARDYHG